MDREKAVAFVEGYGRTWQTWDFEGFADLFADDVVCVEHPTDETVVGRGQILDYIRREQLAAGVVAVRMGMPIVEGDCVVGEFWTTMSKPGEQATLIGALHRATGTRKPGAAATSASTGMRSRVTSTHTRGGASPRRAAVAGLLAGHPRWLTACAWQQRCGSRLLRSRSGEHRLGDSGSGSCCSSHVRREHSGLVPTSATAWSLAHMEEKRPHVYDSAPQTRGPRGEGLYNWWVFIHVVGVLGFVLAHGVSTWVALRSAESASPSGYVPCLISRRRQPWRSTSPTFLLLLGGIAAGI